MQKQQIQNIIKDCFWDSTGKARTLYLLFDKEILISRLNSFPLSWLSNIKTIHSVDITKEMVERLTYDILLEEGNSLRIL